MAETPVKRPFQFSLRMILLAIAIVAGILAWTGRDERRLAAEETLRAEMLESVQDRGGYVGRSLDGSIDSITLPPDAPIEEAQLLSRLFPRAVIAMRPESQNTP